MKKALIGVFVSPILAYIVYFLSLMVVFDLQLDINLFWISIKVLTSLGSKQGLHSLKWLAFIPLFLGLCAFIVTILFSLLSKKSKNDYGKARFASIKDLVKLDLNYDKGLILAKYQNKLIRYSQSLACLIVAPPGTGKTTSIAIPNLLKIENSFVVLDIKGELIRDSAGCRQKVFHNEILIFSPMGKDNTMYFNPFDNKCVKISISLRKKD